MTAVQVVARRGRYEGQVTHARWQGAIAGRARERTQGATAGRGREGTQGATAGRGCEDTQGAPLDVDEKARKRHRWTLM